LPPKLLLPIREQVPLSADAVDVAILDYHLLASVVEIDYVLDMKALQDDFHRLRVGNAYALMHS